MVLTQRLGVLDRVPAPNSCYLAAFSLGLLISVSSISFQACFQTSFLRHTTWTVTLTPSLLAFTELHWPRVHHWNFLLPFTPFLKMSHLEIKWNCSAVFLRIIFFSWRHSLGLHVLSHPRLTYHLLTELLVTHVHCLFLIPPNTHKPTYPTLSAPTPRATALPGHPHNVLLYGHSSPSWRKQRGKWFVSVMLVSSDSISSSPLPFHIQIFR